MGALHDFILGQSNWDFLKVAVMQPSESFLKAAVIYALSFTSCFCEYLR